VKVIDNENGDDLTAITLAQIILEEEKRRSSLISLGPLRELVQHGKTPAQLRTPGGEGRRGDRDHRREGRSPGPGDRLRERRNERPEERRTRPRHGQTCEAAKGFFDELLAAARSGDSRLQRSIDERIKSSVGRITNHPVVQHEVQRIERSIKKLEERLARLRREEGDSPRGGDAIG
jgi:hypothetical protein